MPEKKHYLVNTGLDYMAGGKRRQPQAGEVVSDIPADDVKWLTEQGHITETTAKAKDGEK